MKNKKTIAPARIYLQRKRYDDPYSETTWCADRIDDHNVEYVRADVHNREVRRLKKIIKLWDEATQNNPLRVLQELNLRNEARASTRLDDCTQCEES